MPRCTAPYALVLVLLTGCSRTNLLLSRTHCVADRTDIADAEVTVLGVSASDLLSETAGTFLASATLNTGDDEAIEVTVERGEGSAELVLTTPADGPRPGSPDYSIDVTCGDSVRVPARVLITSDGGTVELEAVGALWLTSHGDQVAAGESPDVTFSATLQEADVTVLPEPLATPSGTVDETSRSLTIAFEDGGADGEIHWSAWATLEDGTAYSSGELLASWTSSVVE